jgi:UDP-N-acetylglucosamine acyltransferase
MAIHPSAVIHPTASISAESCLGEGVRVGPFAVIDGPVTLGAGTAVGAHAHLIGPLRMGVNNRVGAGCVIGSEPQHTAYAGQPTSTEIGDRNVFREYVTIHRGSHVPGWGVTRVGNDGYFMVNAHIGHDAQVGNNAIMVNGSMLGGHSVLQDRAFISGNSALHQFTRLGRLSMTSGCLPIVQDLLPFMTVKSREYVAGVNVVGMRRAGFSAADIAVIRTAYRMIYRSGDILKVGFAKLTAAFPDHPLVAELAAFYATSKRGLIRPVGGEPEDAEG